MAPQPSVELDLLDSYVDLSKIDPGHKRPKQNAYENIPLFKAFTNSNQMKKVEDALIQEDFKAGDIIFNYGDTGDKFYIVLEGEVCMQFPDRANIEDFDHRYGEYKQLLKQIAAQKELTRKKQLVELRKEMLESGKEASSPTMSVERNRQSLPFKDKSHGEAGLVKLGKQSSLIPGQQAKNRS